MAVTAAFRLPGVYFLPAPRAAAVELPPLDVAGFVGFTLRGPLDVPVPIADLKSFDAIFGGPFAVARDAAGNLVYAYLRDAAAGFFSAGGERCYVVRVAGDTASAARFGVPGMLAVDPSGDIGRAEIDASSAGQWGTDLQLGTILSITLLPPIAFAVNPDGTLQWTTSRAPQAVQPGDVLRLTFDDDSQTQWLFPVAFLGQTTADTPTARLEASTLWTVRTAVAASLPVAISTVRRMTPSGFVALDVEASFTSVDSGIGLWLIGPGALQVARDDLLLLDLADGSQHAIAAADAQARPSPGSMPGSGVVVTATDMLSVRNAPNTVVALPGGSAQLQRVERLQLNLRVKYGTDTIREIDGLGFNGGHARFWGDIAVAESGSLVGGPATSSGTFQQQQSETLAPGDATELYGNLFGTTRVDLDWTDPRLGIVLSSLFASASTAPTYLPVGMSLIGSDADLVGPDPEMSASDDLATFSPQLFVDSTLMDNPPATLLSAATYRYFLQDINLKGIHSLMFVDEVALIGVPDATQLGWTPGSAETPLPPAGATGKAPPAAACFVDCAVAPTIVSVDPTIGPLNGVTPVTITGSGFANAGPIGVTFDGRAATDLQASSGTTITCVAPQATAPGPVSVTVTTAVGSASLAAAFFYLQDSTAPPLPLVNTVAASGTAAPASLPAGQFDPAWLQTVHVALIGLCEARADAVAILALPLHFEKQDCIDWLQSLRQNLGLPRHGTAFNYATDIADLSYAAVYHPWLLLGNPNGPAGALRPTPPDGAACGAIAAREIARQVWVAPANVALPGVLDLQPNLSADDWADLFALGFNLIREEATDFRVMSAHTLADDQSLLQLSVRRMLIQLRKALLQRGQDYVFASNDEQFRQRVGRGLEGLLRLMFDGGAFAGVAQQSSYRIAVDGGINTPTDIDQGRMIAQLQVAPSQPMEFLTVLLTRTGAGQLQAAEG
jgi:phage tail sheath protein FI